MDADRLQEFLSEWSGQATRNEIGELLKLTARSEGISLAEGTPSAEAFPVDNLVALLPSVLRRHGSVALNYGPVEGDLGLRQQLIQLMLELEGQEFAYLRPSHLLITSASQQALDLCSRVFITPYDVVLCGLPSYTGALDAFRACGALLSGIPLDDEGLRTDLLRRRLESLHRRGLCPKLLYTNPDFQNPTGLTLSLERRQEILSLARDHDLLVLEDNPCRSLRYCGNDQPSLASLDRDGRVISLFSFSEMLCPGLRLGWIIADPSIISQLVIAKQTVDLCTSGLSQLLAREYLKAGLLPAQLERIRALYGTKRRMALEALAHHVDPGWGVSWTCPEGGLFIWVTLPVWMSATRLQEKALEQNVDFMTGRAFHCDGSGHNTLRLNFGHPELRNLDTAVGRIARCIASMMRERNLGYEAVPASEHAGVA